MITTALCLSFKKELLEGVHALNTDTLKIALYTSGAALDASTEAYSATNEASGVGYAAGGAIITPAAGYPMISGAQAQIRFAPVNWANATITFRGALIYNATKGNRALMVIDFGADVGASNGPLTIDNPVTENPLLILN